MRSKIALLIYCIAILSSMTGCQLAKPNAGADEYGDSLIGLFITTEPLDLFDFEHYAQDNLTGTTGEVLMPEGSTTQYEGRLYAELASRSLPDTKQEDPPGSDEYRFPDAEGISFFSPTILAANKSENYTLAPSDSSITDVNMALNIGDDTSITTLTGTLYISASGKNRVYYLNPVYQSFDGRVYTTEGNGMTVQGMDSEENAVSQTFDFTATTSENGKSKTTSTSITLSLEIMYAPENIVVVQMDADNRLVAREIYEPAAVPETISLSPETTYLIVESHRQNTSDAPAVLRDIYSRDAEELEVFTENDNGICTKQTIEIR